MPRRRAFYCGSLSEMGREGLALDLRSIGASGFGCSGDPRRAPRPPWGLRGPDQPSRIFFTQVHVEIWLWMRINSKLLTKVSTLNLIIFGCGGFVIRGGLWHLPESHCSRWALVGVYRLLSD